MSGLGTRRWRSFVRSLLFAGAVVICLGEADEGCIGLPGDPDQSKDICIAQPGDTHFFCNTPEIPESCGTAGSSCVTCQTFTGETCPTNQSVCYFPVYEATSPGGPNCASCYDSLDTANRICPGGSCPVSVVQCTR